MARIAGVDLPRRKHLAFALPYLYGIGPKTARDICDKTGIPANRRVDELSDADVKAIRDVLDADFKVEGDLRREVQTQHQAADGSRLLPRTTASQVVCR
jgi:small subunit ribosomal protein S13